MISRSETEDVLRLLLAERPDLHGGGEATNWQLGSRLLDWLVGEVPLGGSSLETGCGYSTIVLGALARRHVAISPVAVEHERIRRWCARHGLDLGATELVEAPSEVHLPAAVAAGALAPESLDLVLIDGDHAFPVPALDWYLTAPLLKVGGLVVVDDTHIRACGDVAAFLAAEEGRWRLRHRVDEAAVFEKLAPDVHAHGSWRAQPWNRETPSVDARLRALRSRLGGRR